MRRPAQLLLLFIIYVTASAVSAQIVFTERPASVSAKTGESFSLGCAAEVQGDPSATILYSWTRDGLVISDQQRLVFPSATLKHAGTYVCIASSNALRTESNPAVVTVSQSKEKTLNFAARIATLKQSNENQTDDSQSDDNQMTVIVIAVSVGVLGSALVTLVICVWLYLCLRETHIWEKAPLGSRRRNPLIHRTGEEGDLEEEFEEPYTPMALSRRSKSLTTFPKDGGTYFHDQALSLSIENLLPDTETDLHKTEDLDFDLNLDESLFEHKTPPTKSQSDAQINAAIATMTPIQQQIKPLPIDDLSKRHRKQSDPYYIFQHMGESQKLDLYHGSRTSAQSDNQSQRLDSYHGSRRASAQSDNQSDTSEAISGASQSQSRGSSYLKSVRFDLEEDSGIDSIPVTGTSTPYYRERRASEPECKTAPHLEIERRGSAPECKTLASDSEVSDNSEDMEALESTRERTEGGETQGETEMVWMIGETEVTSEAHSSATDTGKQSTTADPNEAEIKETDEKDQDNTTQVSTPEEQAPADNQALPDTPQRQPLVTADTDTPQRQPLVTADTDAPPQPPIAAPEPPTEGHISTGKVAHLKEHWTGLTSEVEGPKSTSRLHSAGSEFSAGKVAEIRQKFQQQNTKEAVPLPEAKRHRQLSVLVSEVTKQLFKEQESSENPQEPKNSRPQSQSELHTSESSSSSVFLSASGPQLDLSVVSLPKEEELHSENQHAQEKPADKKQLENPESEITESEDADLQDHLNPDEENEDDTGKPPSPLLDRNFVDIPVFALPFTSSAWQPSHLRGQQPSGLWAFSSRSNSDLEQDGEVGDSDSSEEDEMITPLPVQMGLASVSPIGKGLFSQIKGRSLLSPHGRFHHPASLSGVKHGTMTASEPFHRPSTLQQRMATRLSVIPEESPSGSMTDVLTLCT